MSTNMNLTSLLEWLEIGSENSTWLDGLHPRAQEMGAQARSCVESMTRLDDIQALGAGTVKELVGDAYFAALDRTGQKASERGYGYVPELRTLGGRNVRWESPLPQLLAVPSKVSGRAAVVVVHCTEIGALGWGDLDSAWAGVEGIYDDLLTANRRVVDITRAFATLRALLDEAERLEPEDDGSALPDRGPAF